MSGPENECPHCGRWIECYVTTKGTLHLFGHRIGIAGVGAERGPWCPKSGAQVGT